jgi:hypothetical protein
LLFFVVYLLSTAGATKFVMFRKWKAKKHSLLLSLNLKMLLNLYEIIPFWKKMQLIGGAYPG